MAGNRCNHITQLLDIELDEALRKLLLLVHQEVAVGILEELLFGDFQALSLDLEKKVHMRKNAYRDRISRRSST